MRARKLIVPPSVKPGIPRIEQFPRSWRRVPFGDLLEPAMRPVKLEANRLYQLVIAKRNRGGIAPREQLRGDQIKTAGQFVLREGDFVIAKRQIIHGACGFVPKSLDGAIVSGEYDVFRVREPLRWRFLEWFTHTTYFQQTTYQSSIGVAIEKMIFNTERWLRVLMPLPPADVQASVASTLDSVHRAERCCSRLIDAQRRMKRALLQQLLAGKSRTKARVFALADVVRLRSGNTPSKDRPDYWEGDFPWISAKDLKRPRIGDSIDKITALDGNTEFWRAHRVHQLRRLPPPERLQLPRSSRSDTGRWPSRSRGPLPAVAQMTQSTERGRLAARRPFSWRHENGREKSPSWPCPPIPHLVGIHTRRYLMKKDNIAALLVQFEALVRTEQGVEFWFARDLQPLLGYDRWENFAKLLDRAKTACAGAGQPVNDHFRDVTKMVRIGSGSERAVEDVALTRYACYLLAQNGDPRKEAIAFAQSYFAVQTRRLEQIEQRLLEVDRVRARARLVESERELSAVIFERVGNELSFARIRSKGDMALFGGLNTQQMKDRLDVPDGRPLADFLPTVTIKAKDFANEMTVHNTKERNLTSEGQITGEHVENNRQVRETMRLRGIVPEELPAAEDLKKVQRRLANAAKQLPKGKVLPDDGEEAGQS